MEAHNPGNRETQTIVEIRGNSLILRCTGSEHGLPSRFASNLIGEREVIREEHSRGRSHGGTFSRSAHDSVWENVSYRQGTEHTVRASELEQLADLQGFLKLASRRAWMRVVALTAPS